MHQGNLTTTTIQSTFALLNELDNFHYTLSGTDRIWQILFPSGTKRWNFLYISKYQDETVFISHVNGNSRLEIKPDRSIEVQTCAVGFAFNEKRTPAAVWELLIKSSLDWLKFVSEDWISAAKRVREKYPLRYRYGKVPHSIIRAFLLGMYRLDTELGNDSTWEFVRLVENGYFTKRANFEVSSLTGADYFCYCRTAYLAGQRPEENVDTMLSGRKMYERYADGRHEGLLDIAPDSPQGIGGTLVSCVSC